MTYGYHQICSSDLVSQGWLNYLRLFDPIDVNVATERDFGRDFRSYGLIYFQLLSTVCSMARANVEDAQTMFGSTVVVNSHVLSSDVYRERIVSIGEAFIRTTHDHFLQVLNWADVTNQINTFLTGTNINFRMSLMDGEAQVKDSRYYLVSKVNNDDVIIRGVCSCSDSAIQGGNSGLLYLDPLQVTWTYFQGLPST